MSDKSANYKKLHEITIKESCSKSVKGLFKKFI